MSGGGGGGTTYTKSDVTQNSIPAYAQPYVMQMLQRGADLTGATPPEYTGQKVAGFSPLQTGAMKDIASMQTSPQLDQASGMTGQAALQSGQYANSSNNFYNPNVYQNFSGQNVDQYMSPYMNDVVDAQKRAAVADYGRSLPNMNAGAAAAGQLGGTRSALMQAEGNRNLQGQLQGIQATGSQAAYENAQNQFNQQQQARMANMQNYAQFGLQGRDLGLRALAQKGQLAGQLGNLGQQQFQQQAGIDTARLGAGALQQQQNQTLLNTGLQSYYDQLNRPYSQLGFMSSLIHGLPLSQGTSTMYQAPGSTAGQIAGLGLGLGSLFGALG